MRDLWPGPIVDSFNFALPFSYPGSELVRSGGLVYFPFLEPAHGRELWRSDGTPEGTRLIRDITPGPAGRVELLAPLGDGLLFLSGFELWWTGGTAAETVLLGRFLDLRRPVSVAPDGVAFFRGCSSLDGGCALWRTDGTEAGTRALTAPTGDLATHWLIAAAGLDRVYFVTNRAPEPGSGGAEVGRLWLYQRPTENASQLLETPFSDLVLPVAVGEDLLFVEGTAEAPRILWRSDGTPSGTDPLFESDGDLRIVESVLGSTAFVFETLGGDDCRLLAIQGVDVTPLADLTSCFGTGSAVVTGPLLRFVDGESRLWASDGTAAGTSVVAVDMPNRSFTVTPLGLVFRTPAGPGSTFADSVMLLPFGGGSLRTLVDGLVQVGAVSFLGTEIVFTGGPETAPQDLWVSDGTSAGTRVAVPLGISAGGPIAPSAPRQLGRRAQEVLLLADDDPIFHPDPWRTDGTPAGTARLAEDGQLQASDAPPDLATFESGALWRRAASRFPDPNLWLLDPVDGSVSLLDELRSDDLLSLEVDGRLLFAAEETEPDGTTDAGLYSTDGTVDGTTRIAGASPSALFGSPSSAELAGDLYFDGLVGAPLAFSDEALFRIAVDGGEPQQIEGFPPPRLARDTIDQLVSASERLFVTTSVSTAGGPPLDPDDPFPSGDSLLVLESRPPRLEYATFPDSLAARAEGLSFDLSGPVVFRGRLALRARTIAEGGPPEAASADRLLLTDGAAGLELASLAPAPFDLDWSPTAVGDLLYFTPLTPNEGQELWFSDGTPDGTGPVTDLAPGLEGSSPHHLRAVDGQLLFAASTPATGSELWATDGTPEGTRLLVDLAEDHHSGDPADPTPLGDRILFAGHRDDVGRELFSFDRRELEPSCSTEPVTGSVCLGDERFRVSVDWLDRVSGQRGRATGSALTRDTASFWFFEEDNVELLVKVLDGRGINDTHWVYTGAVSDVTYWVTVFDTVTGESVTYENRQGSQCGVGDVDALPEDDERAGLFGLLGPLPPADPPVPGPDNASATCVPSEHRLCLQDGRFTVEVAWESPLATPLEGRGRAVPATTDSGYFWFFSPENVELVVKVLDGRAINAHYWVYTGALSDVAYTVTVTDTLTGTVRTYDNAEGSQCGRGDVEAFPSEDDSSECTPPREVAISPRADRLAEELAAFYGPRAWAEDPLYERVAGELDAIRDLEPAIEDFPFFTPGYALGEVALIVDPPTRDAILAGEYDEWSCPNHRFRMEVTAYDFSHVVVVRSQAVLDPRPLEPLYATLPGVEDTFLNGLGTIPECSLPRACLEREGDPGGVFTYFFQNDRCVVPFPASPPAYRFRLDDGEVLDAESWTPGDEPRPDWVDDFEACLEAQLDDLVP